MLSAGSIDPRRTGVVTPPLAANTFGARSTFDGKGASAQGKSVGVPPTLTGLWCDTSPGTRGRTVRKRVMNIQNMAMWTPGWMELVVIAGVGLLIFGRRLPDVARSVGKSIVEFKKGMRDVKEDIDAQPRIEPPAQPKLDHQPQSTGPASAASPSATGSESAPANEQSGTAS